DPRIDHGRSSDAFHISRMVVLIVVRVVLGDPHAFPTRRSSDHEAIEHTNDSAEITVVAGDLVADLDLGGSLAVNGVCQGPAEVRSEEHTSELQSRFDLVCRLLLGKKNSTRRPPRAPRCSCGAPCPPIRWSGPRPAPRPRTRRGHLTYRRGRTQPRTVSRGCRAPHR